MIRRLKITFSDQSTLSSFYLSSSDFLLTAWSVTSFFILLLLLSLVCKCIIWIWRNSWRIFWKTFLCDKTFCFQIWIISFEWIICLKYKHNEYLVIVKVTMRQLMIFLKIRLIDFISGSTRFTRTILSYINRFKTI